MVTDTGTVTVEEKRPEYAWVFDIAIAAGFGLAVAAALINQHRIHKRLLELVESTKRTRADSMRELEATLGEPDRVAAGDDDE
jgi:predicted metal-dependent HD superfamily phosphohydrolase